MFKMLKTFTTTPPLLALVGPGGVFDVLKAKPPLDRDWDCVTGSPLSSCSFPSSSSSSSPPSSIVPSELQRNTSDIRIDHTLAQPNPTKIIASFAECANQLPTPPSTPDDDDKNKGFIQGHQIFDSRHKDALDLLLTMFPKQGAQALPFAKSVSICIPAVQVAHEAVVLELAGQPRTLFVDGRSMQTFDLRECVVALMDLASESLQCSALVIILDKSSSRLGELMHSLMYAGGAVVSKPLYDLDPNLLLVGLEI